jgi:hypothetical protein
MFDSAAHGFDRLEREARVERHAPALALTRDYLSVTILVDVVRRMSIAVKDILHR